MTSLLQVREYQFVEVTGDSEGATLGGNDSRRNFRFLSRIGFRLGVGVGVAVTTGVLLGWVIAVAVADGVAAGVSEVVTSGTDEAGVGVGRGAGVTTIVGVGDGVAVGSTIGFELEVSALFIAVKLTLSGVPATPLPSFSL
jgi:hypothetical protein